MALCPLNFWCCCISPSIFCSFLYYRTFGRLVYSVVFIFTFRPPYLLTIVLGRGNQSFGDTLCRVDYPAVKAFAQDAFANFGKV